MATLSDTDGLKEPEPPAWQAEPAAVTAKTLGGGSHLTDLGSLWHLFCRRALLTWCVGLVFQVRLGTEEKDGGCVGLWSADLLMEAGQSRQDQPMTEFKSSLCMSALFLTVCPVALPPVRKHSVLWASPGISAALARWHSAVTAGVAEWLNYIASARIEMRSSAISLLALKCFWLFTICLAS